MSRIGKLPVAIPSKVSVTLDGQTVTVKGPKGELRQTVHELVSVELEGNAVVLTPVVETRDAKALHGLTRSLLSNMVEGVSEGFKRTLLINGVGYRVEQFKRFLRFDLGYSHPIFYELPEGVDATIGKSGKEGLPLELSGIDKKLVGQSAATIRGLRKPEPYKGKGIRYSDEVLLRKAGKAGGK